MKLVRELRQKAEQFRQLASIPTDGGRAADRILIEMAEQFDRTYEPRGRVLLACCAFLGWVLGVADAFPDSFTSRLFAFVVGGVIVTSAHEELPAEQGSRFFWFVGGAAMYATLLMLI